MEAAILAKIFFRIMCPFNPARNLSAEVQIWLYQ